jgi:pimeloyl-ACP methyl ester carboxylesterase
MTCRIESLMSARLFLAPQHHAGRLYFVSNISGRLSLYAMDHGGSVPEPLLPPDIALQNPDLIGGYPFHIFPKISRILVMIDRNGDENYQPMLISMAGAFPEPAFENYFAPYRVHLVDCDMQKNIIYLVAERRDAPILETYQGDLKSGKLVKLTESPWGKFPAAYDANHRQLVLSEGYTLGDVVLSLMKKGKLRILYGKPLEERKPGEVIPVNGIGSAVFSPEGGGLIVTSAVSQDTFSLGYLSFDKPNQIAPIKIKGVVHDGVGEMERIVDWKKGRFLIQYNIDGCSWAYEATFDETELRMNLDRVLVGKAPLENGKLESIDYDEEADLYVLSFSTATSPTQIYTVEGRKRKKFLRHTNEIFLGVPQKHLSAGEDASFVSHDGLRVSARLYFPSKSLGFTGARPVVYYIHGGPQGQERPNFAWFSMPLIQFLTLRGFAVFVPNVRGSTGYGFSYVKRVDRDWGGEDRLDHVHAMSKVLPLDERLDVKRAAVVGRSYGGYMTLMLAGRHPDLWVAACDMFGPYDLLTFSERIPETWKPYYKIALGDPEKPADKAFLIERSPKTYLSNLSGPMLVIQGRNDPRVAAAESEDLVKELRAQGKQMELLIFENEGHDVLKYENRVACYNSIADFFARYLNP